MPVQVIVLENVPPLAFIVPVTFNPSLELYVTPPLARLRTPFDVIFPPASTIKLSSPILIFPPIKDDELTSAPLIVVPYIFPPVQHSSMQNYYH